MRVLVFTFPHALGFILVLSVPHPILTLVCYLMVFTCFVLVHQDQTFPSFLCKVLPVFIILRLRITQF